MLVLVNMLKLACKPNSILVKKHTKIMKILSNNPASAIFDYNINIYKSNIIYYNINYLCTNVCVGVSVCLPVCVFV